MLYAILSIIIILISYGCLRNNNKGIFAVCTLSFIISAVITTVVSVTVFFCTCKPVEHKSESAVLKLDEDDNTFRSKIENFHFSEISCNKPEIGKKSYVVREYDVLGSSELSDLISFDFYVNRVTSRKIVLTKKDYEVYKAYINNDK